MDFDELFSDVLNIDSGIRYAAVPNNAGNIIAGCFRENIIPFLNDDDLQMMHYYASRRW